MFLLCSWATALLISDDLTRSVWVWLMAATDGGTNQMTEVSCFLENVGSFGPLAPSSFSLSLSKVEVGESYQLLLIKVWTTWTLRTSEQDSGEVPSL